MPRNDAKRPARSEGEIERFVRTFHYEVDMLVSQGLLYLDHGREIAEDHNNPMRHTVDALLDSILNRLRAFDEFFSSRNAKFDHDARASDLALTVKWELRRPILDCDTRTRISRQPSHLTYDRPDEEWGIGLMIREALEMIGKFLRTTRVDDAKWDRLLEKVNRTLDDWGDRGKIRTARKRHAFHA